jgi:hypothetical protein
MSVVNVTDKEMAQAQALRAMEARKDAAYLERNQLVALLSKIFPAGKRKTAIEGWSEDWHGCVYIDLPTGQASWHYHDSQAHLFEHLPEYQGEYDGHTTEQKYQRIEGYVTPNPKAWAIFVESGNARMWSTFQPHVQALADAEGLTVTPLYTAQQPAVKTLEDAARYRWLFNDVTLEAIKDACDKGIPLPPTHSDVLNEIMGFCITKERADSLIDSAMGVER